jgi:hypothetical protein
VVRRIARRGLCLLIEGLRRRSLVCGLIRSTRQGCRSLGGGKLVWAVLWVVVSMLRGAKKSVKCKIEVDGIRVSVSSSPSTPASPSTASSLSGCSSPSSCSSSSPSSTPSSSNSSSSSSSTVSGISAGAFPGSCTCRKGGNCPAAECDVLMSAADIRIRGMLIATYVLKREGRGAVEVG